MDQPGQGRVPANQPPQGEQGPAQGPQRPDPATGKGHAGLPPRCLGTRPAGPAAAPDRARHPPQLRLPRGRNSSALDHPLPGRRRGRAELGQQDPRIRPARRFRTVGTGPGGILLRRRPPRHDQFRGSQNLGTGTMALLSELPPHGTGQRRAGQDMPRLWLTAVGRPGPGPRNGAPAAGACAQQGPGFPHQGRPRGSNPDPALPEPVPRLRPPRGRECLPDPVPTPAVRLRVPARGGVHGHQLRSRNRRKGPGPPPTRGRQVHPGQPVPAVQGVRTCPETPPRAGTHHR